jgi:hypothetical protein
MMAEAGLFQGRVLERQGRPVDCVRPIGSIGQKDVAGRHLRRQTQQVQGSRPARLGTPPELPGQRAGDLVPFLEVHTQIHGLGRMQKFREHHEETLYEDVLMPVGFTHDPSCRVAGPNSWEYPWHRYYSDTDSIWLAIELHPLPNAE